MKPIEPRAEPPVAEVPGAQVERPRTFLFTDVERSVQAWDADATEMLATLDAHQAIFVDVASRHGGTFIADGGDGWQLAFDRAGNAIVAAAEAQRAIDQLRPGPSGRVRVRMGIHTGTPVFSAAGDFRGRPLNVAGRLHKAAHGGQIVVTEATRAAVADELPPSVKLVSLGEYRLRDLPPATYYQVHARGLQVTFPPLVAVVVAQGRLGAPSTSLLGRSEALTNLRSLSQPGLLTLSGLGGVGKTRLALALAAELLSEYPDGIRACDLRVTRRAEAAPEIVADALGIEPGQSTVDRIAESLAPKRLVLLLDNCEHVLGPIRDLARTILRSCPHVLVLATSRLALAVPGEREYLVEPLGMEDDDDGLPAAVRLFRERAGARATFDLDSIEDAETVRALCRRLDGLPLAIELAAAQTRYLQPIELLARLDRGDELTDSQDQDPIGGVLAWSTDQLDDQGRTTLHQLAVFEGGFTLAAAEAVLQGVAYDRPLLTRLADLIDRSLVQVERTEAGGTRYHLLETIRAYCRSESEDSELDTELRRRHLEYYLGLVEQHSNRLRTEEEPEAVELFDREFTNLRAAHDTSIDLGDAESSGRLILALSDFCFVRLRFEFYQWVDRAVAITTEPDPALPEIYGLAATGAFLRGDLAETERLARLGLASETPGNESYHVRFMLTVATAYSEREDEAQEWVMQALEWCNQRSDSFFRVVTLVASSMGLSLGGEWELARTVADLALDEASLSGNQTCISWALYARAEAIRREDPDDAAKLLSAALEIAKQVQGAFIIGFALGAQAAIHRSQGKLLSAAAEVLELLDHWGRRGHLPQQWLILREGQLVLAQAERFEEAATILGALPRGIALPPDELDQQQLTAAEAAIDAALGPTRRMQLGAIGASLGLAEVSRLAHEALRELANSQPGPARQLRT